MQYPIVVREIDAYLSWTFKDEDELLTHFKRGGFQCWNGRRYSYHQKNGDRVPSEYLAELRERSGWVFVGNRR